MIPLRRFATGLALVGFSLIFVVLFTLLRHTFLKELRSNARYHKDLQLITAMRSSLDRPAGELSEAEREQFLRQAVEVPDRWTERCIALGGGIYRVQLLNPEGQVIGSSHPGPTVAPPAREYLPAPGQPHFCHEGNGRQYLIAPVTQSGQLMGYVMLSSLDPSSLDVLRLLFRLAVLAIPPLMLIVVLKTWLAARVIARPLENLSECAARVSAGDLKTRVDPIEGPLEVCRASSAFNEMLGQLQALIEAQSSFVADASHELRTPLASLRGQLYTLSSLQTQDEPRVAHALELSNREIRRMSTLVDGLLALTRAESPSQAREQLSLPQTLDEVISLTAPLFPAREILYRDHGLSPIVSAEEGELVRAIRNVLENALIYSQHTPVVVELAEEEGYCCIHISDQGPGVPAQDIPHLGKRFFRVDRSRSRHSGGTGLGLAITMAILRNLGGSLEFVSQAGAGSRVTLRLPQSPPNT